MGYFFSWASFSKSATESWLDASEITILICGLVLAIGAAGEYIEEHGTLPLWMKWSQRPKMVFVWMVAISLAGEFVGDAGVFVFSGHLQTINDGEVAALNKEAGEARREAGNANKEAAALRKQAEDEAMARVKVEREFANEDIPIDDLGPFARKLSGFAGQRAEIDVFPVTFEHWWIAGEIEATLGMAHWNVAHLTPLLAPPSPFFLVSGIWIQSTGDAPSRSAAHALREVLRSSIADGSSSDVPLPEPNRPRVWIYVGDKPLPLRSWVKTAPKQISGKQISGNK